VVLVSLSVLPVVLETLWTQTTMAVVVAVEAIEVAL
jgi:hypothetical protein